MTGITMKKVGFESARPEVCVFTGARVPGHPRVSAGLMPISERSGLPACGQMLRLSRQHGFSLVEVSMVTALMILIAIVGIPAIQGYVIENRVPRVAEDLQRFVARLKVSAMGAGVSPYLQVGQTTLINGLRDAAAIQIQSKGHWVQHGLGATRRENRSSILLAPAASPGGPEGSAFKIVITDVNHAACPALAAVLQRLAIQVKVGGHGPLTEVKNVAVKPGREYDPILADSQCGSGDVNTFEFVIQ